MMPPMAAACVPAMRCRPCFSEPEVQYSICAICHLLLVPLEHGPCERMLLMSIHLAQAPGSWLVQGMHAQAKDHHVSLIAMCCLSLCMPILGGHGSLPVLCSHAGLRGLQVLHQHEGQHPLLHSMHSSRHSVHSSGLSDTDPATVVQSYSRPQNI